VSGAATVEGRFAGPLGAFSLDAGFSFPAKGLTALIGPSGSGKTTLLRCIAGLIRLPGALRVSGEVWQDAAAFLPPHRRAVGMVFQEASLLPHLTVAGNLAYGMKRAGTAQTIARDEVVEMLGLGPLLSRSTANLSGGERQRVAIGRALLSQPRLLLMDEPLAGLDAASKAEIAPYLERLHRALSIPVLYVSHDLAEVTRLADHVLVMGEGRVVEMRKGEPGQGEADASLAHLSAEDIRSLARAALKAGLKPQAGGS